MTSSIPDGISFSELQSHLEQAPKEADITTDESLSVENLIEMAREHKTALWEEAKHPLAMKFLLLEVLTDMIAWHKRMAEEMLKNEEYPAMGDWMTDAGALMAFRNTLIEIEVTPDDHTPSWKRDEDQ